MKKVVLFIRSLEIGGAERQLVVLAKGLKSRGVKVCVITFYSGGALRGELETAGIQVEDLDKRGRWDVVSFFIRLIFCLRQNRSEILYSFLPTANSIGLIAGRLVGVRHIVWGVRASKVDLSQYDKLSLVDTFIARHLSRFADRIICNSKAGAWHHARMGYPPDKLAVIENGIDTTYFRFDAKGRARLRKEWCFRDNDILIGLVARLDPMKDHETFLQAAALLVRTLSNVRFVCIGDGEADYSQALKDRAVALGVDNHIRWFGSRLDMPAVYSAFDIVTSSSAYGEGFSNMVAEAMACERFCIVTDVGDSARIIGDNQWVVPARKPQMLARSWQMALRNSPEVRMQQGQMARTRIETHFSTDRMVEKTMLELGLC